MPELIISVSGIRGIVGAGFTPAVARHFAAAFADYLAPGLIIFGRDSRPSGASLKEDVIAALQSTGRTVYDLGIVPTPTVQLAVELCKAAGGIALTASHNPQEWNALKFIGPTGCFLNQSESRKFLDQAERREPATGQTAGKRVAVADPLAQHLERLLANSLLDSTAIRRSKLRVALDAVHGAGGAIGRRLLESLGCQFDILFEEPTGQFPRPPEPLAENITALRQHVQQGNYDVGFAFDPDVDRLALVDECGRALGEEATLALAVWHVLSQRPGPVVTNLSTSAKVEAVATRFNSPVIRTPVGEANVVEGIRQAGAVIGGEGNGGVILPQMHLGRDAPVGLSLILGLLAQTGKPLSALADELPALVMVKERVRTESAVNVEALRRVFKGAMPGSSVDTRDGIRVSLGYEWVHIRRSGTEPIVRIIAEAETEQRVKELILLARQGLA